MEFIYTNDKSAVGVTVAIFDRGGYGDVIANRNRTSSTMTKRLTAIFSMDTLGPKRVFLFLFCFVCLFFKKKKERRRSEGNSNCG